MSQTQFQGREGNHNSSSQLSFYKFDLIDCYSYKYSDSFLEGPFQIFPTQPVDSSVHFLNERESESESAFE